MRDLNWGWGRGGLIGSPHLGLGRCRLWEETCGSWLESSFEVKNMPVLEGAVGQGGQNAARMGGGWCNREHDRSVGASGFLRLYLGHEKQLEACLIIHLENPSSLASILECKMCALEVPQRLTSTVASLHRAQRGSEACPGSHSHPAVEPSPQIPYKSDTGSQISAKIGKERIFLFCVCA